MKKTFTLLVLAILLFQFSCKEKEEQSKSAYKYEYESVENDGLNTLIYTLDNGLKVYMSINKDEPRIQTNIAVKTGSKQDPSDATGLAHYLEHMLFKGTSKIATVNWEEEKRFYNKFLIYTKKEEPQQTIRKKMLFTNK